MSPSELKAKRAEIERQTAEFLASGGVILEIPTGVLANTPADARRAGHDRLFESKGDDWIDARTAAVILDCVPTTLNKLLKTPHAPSTKTVNGRMYWYKPDIMRLSSEKTGRLIVRRGKAA